MPTRTFHATLQLLPNGRWVATVAGLAEATGSSPDAALRAVALTLERAVQDRAARRLALPADRADGVAVTVRVP